MSEQEAVCSCGAKIIHVPVSSEPCFKYWRRDGTGEVCAEGHWHAPAESANAELLRLLAHHHAAWVAEDRLHPEDDDRCYAGTELYLKTVAAIAAKGATMKDAYGLGDQLRTRVPVWRCPACKMKFHTRAEYDAHMEIESALKERV